MENNNESANTPNKFGQPPHLDLMQPIRPPGEEEESQITNTAQILAANQPKANFVSHM